MFLVSGEIISAPLTDEIETALLLAKKIRKQDNFIKDMDKAILAKDVADLNTLLLQCDSIDMGAHPVVLKAQDTLSILLEKRKVNFLLLIFFVILINCFYLRL